MDHWSEALTNDEYRDDPRVKDTPDLDTVIKRWFDSDSEVSRRIPIPGEQASEDDREKFFNKLADIPGVVRLDDEGGLDAASKRKLGIPEGPDGYTIDDTIAKALGLDEDGAKKWRERAHGRGITKAQLNGLLEDVAKDREAMVEAGNKTALEIRTAMKERWGLQYNQRIADIGIAEEQYGIKGLRENPIVGNNLELLEALADLGSQYREDTSSDVNSSIVGKLPSQHEAQTEIDEVTRNPDHPYNNKNHPQHTKWVDKIYQLRRIAVGDQPDGTRVAS